MDILEEIIGQKLLNPKCLEIYALLYRKGPATAAEIWVESSQFNKGSVSARLSDLQAFGCVIKIGARVCSITKKRASLFEANGELPEKPKPKPVKIDLEDWSVRAKVCLSEFLKRVNEPEKLKGQDKWLYKTATELIEELYDEK